MMEQVVIPKVDLQSQKVQIVVLHKSVGDPVARDEVVLEATTDKATIDVVSPCDGVVAALHGGEGDEIAVGSPVAVIAASAEEARRYASERTQAPTPNNYEGVTPDRPPAVVVPAPETRGRVRSSPAARKLCRHHGVTVEEVYKWTGREPVNEANVEEYVRDKGRPDESSGYVLEELSNVRQAVARRMNESASTKPHIYLIDQIEVSELVSIARTDGERKGEGIPNFTDMMLHGVVRSLGREPILNCHVVDVGDRVEVRRFKDVNLGVAVATEHGLMVAVLHAANRLSLRELAQKKADLVGRARQLRLSPTEVTGSTITVTNLGSLGVPMFMPIINPPEAAIIGIGAIRYEPRSTGTDVVHASVVNVCLALDHRARDGADGARFLKTLKDTIENPSWVDPENH